MTQTVVGIFDDSGSAQNAYERLTSAGFSVHEVDITDQSNLVGQESTSTSRDHSDNDFGDRVSRFFRNLFDDEQDAEKFSSAAQKGTVVSVYAESREKAERAADILDEAGAINVDERLTGSKYNERRLSQEETGEGRVQGFRDQERSHLGEADSSNRSIPVIQEALQVGKREVETGGMRVRSRIIDRPVEESLRLRHERVTLERNPVNRPATESDLNTFRDGEIEIRERAEVPVVNKQARVVEEINVRKDVQEREETVRDTVRKTDVEVEQLDGDRDTLDTKSRSKRKV